MAMNPMVKAFALVAILAFVVFILSKNTAGSPSRSMYASMEQYPAMTQAESIPPPPPPMVMQEQDAQMLGGVSSGLLPKEPVNQEDFGSFSAESVLSGQNFLDPRAQIGYPETVGGTLRNSNLQLRSEPSNPRDPVSIFNLSTIVPDTMRPAFEIGAA